MATDALSQFVALVHRLDQVGPRPRDIDQYIERTTSLSVGEAWMCLRQLQLWLASFPAEDSATFVIQIVEIVALYRITNPPTLQEIYKAFVTPERTRGMTMRPTAANLDEDDDDLEGGGAGFDAAAWLDKAGDELARDDAIDTMELFLFKTAALILSNMRTLNGLKLVPPAAVHFFFTSIEQGSTLHVQRCAAYCAGVLSADHLPALLEQFFERQKSLPEKRFRWLLYQQATQLFSFGVATQQQARPAEAPPHSGSPFLAPHPLSLAPPTHPHAAFPLPADNARPQPRRMYACTYTRTHAHVHIRVALSLGAGGGDRRVPRGDGEEDHQD